MWLNSSNNIYCVNRKPGTVSPMLFKAMFLCQKLLGNGLFCVFLSQFLRMPIQIMSTKWKKIFRSLHCTDKKTHLHSKAEVASTILCPGNHLDN